MENLPPLENNPFNPLFEVVALKVTKVTEEGYRNRIKIDCSLNFKMAQSLEAIDVDDQGNAVQSVTFALSVKRAVLSIKFDQEQAPGLSIERIAHLDENYTLGRIDTSIEHVTSRKVELVAKILERTPTTDTQLTGDEKEDLGNSSWFKSKRGSGPKTIMSCVSGTFDDIEAHWLIEHNVVNGDGEHQQHISGEIFPIDNLNQRMYALTTGKTEYSGDHVNVTASVHVKLEDINVSDIRVIGSDGRELSKPIHLTDSDERTKLKLKFVKQLVKRHLGELGLENSGGIIEVCRAYA